MLSSTAPHRPSLSYYVSQPHSIEQYASRKRLVMTVVTEVASVSVVYVFTLHRVCIHVPEEKSAHQLETFGSAGSI